MTDSIDAEAQALIAANDHLEVVQVGEAPNQRTRVKCDLTGHEMMPTTSAINTYLASKKYKKARDWYNYDFSKYEPYIVPHRRKHKCLYCNVTNQILNRIPAEVEKHVNGKKFKRMKEHVKVKESDGTGKDDHEFDADLFEFENAQVLVSDEEEDEGLEEEKVEDDFTDLYPSDEEDSKKRKQEDVQMETTEEDVDMEKKAPKRTKRKA